MIGVHSGWDRGCVGCERLLLDVEMVKLPGDARDLFELACVILHQNVPLVAHPREVPPLR